MAPGGMILKFDPEEALKRVEEKIGRPMTEEEKKTRKDFMQGMLSLGLQAGQVFSLPTDEIGGEGEHGKDQSESVEGVRGIAKGH